MFKIYCKNKSTEFNNFRIFKYKGHTADLFKESCAKCSNAITAKLNHTITAK